MAKEDLLREEMGRLEIEPVRINRSSSNANPFHSMQQKKNLFKRTVSKKCTCSFQKYYKKGHAKTKCNSVLKEPVLKIRKNSEINITSENIDCQQMLSYDSLLSSLDTDVINLCTLVQNCNQLKISTPCKEPILIDPLLINENKWWKSNESNDRQHHSDLRQHQPSCSQQALNPTCDVTIDELASYFETLVHIPKKMSSMAEMMYI